MLPVLPPLAPLFDAGGLRRGTAVAVRGSASLLLSVLAGPSAAGAWCAVVGLPSLGLVAAAEAGMDLDRLALVPDPGRDWAAVVGALLDAVDVVAVAPRGRVLDGDVRRLAARARQRGAVLVPYGAVGWPGADLRLSVTGGAWEGLGSGSGHLRARRAVVRGEGRGSAARARELRLWLPAPGGGVAADTEPVVPALRVPASSGGMRMGSALRAVPSPPDPSPIPPGGEPARFRPALHAVPPPADSQPGGTGTPARDGGVVAGGAVAGDGVAGGRSGTHASPRSGSGVRRQPAPPAGRSRPVPTAPDPAASRPGRSRPAQDGRRPLPPPTPAGRLPGGDPGARPAGNPVPAGRAAASVAAAETRASAGRAVPPEAAPAGPYPAGRATPTAPAAGARDPGRVAPGSGGRGGAALVEHGAPGLRRGQIPPEVLARLRPASTLPRPPRPSRPAPIGRGGTGETGETGADGRG